MCAISLQNIELMSSVDFVLNSNCVSNWHHLVRGATQVLSTNLLIKMLALTANICFRYHVSLKLFATPGEPFPSVFFSWFLKVLCVFILMIIGICALVLLQIIRATHSWYTHFPLSYLIAKSQEKKYTATFSLLSFKSPREVHCNTTHPSWKN